MGCLCRIELLGGLRVRCGEHTIYRFRTHKTAELLAYLAFHLASRPPRELLVDLFWPERDAEDGRHNLSVALSSLRQQLSTPSSAQDPGIILADRHTVALNREVVTTDVAQFVASLRAASRSKDDQEAQGLLVRAVDLYAGELLPGYYNEWVLPEQQRLQELIYQALRQLVGLLERTGELGRALQYALRATREDPLREEAHRDVIRLYNMTGRPDLAMRQYVDIERRLERELDTAPSEETRRLVARLGASDTPARRLCTHNPSDRRPGSAESAPVSRGISTDLLEPIGGAVPLHSRFYVIRGADGELHSAVERRDSIVLIKGARQVGKTSLLARGMQQAREQGCVVALSHFQMFSSEQLASADAFLLALAETMWEQLNLPVHPADAWDSRRGPSPNLRRYVRREVLPIAKPHLLWGMDEVDRIFACPFGSDVFGLFRSWHDERALDPEGPWASLTLAISYSTEAHLFITDITQSPFNVGTRLALEDFTLDQVSDLNRRYGAPLKSAADVGRFHRLVDGHPYLVRRGLHELSSHGTDLALFEKLAPAEHWIYGDHLRRLAVLASQDEQLSFALREVLAGRPCPARSSFYRLRSAGVLSGEAAGDAHLRCRLYSHYLSQYFACSA